MKISVKNISEEAVRAGALVLPFFEGDNADVYAGLDYLTDGFIRKITGSKEFTGKQNQLALLHVRNINAERVLLAGLGKKSAVSAERIRQAGGKALTYLRELGIADAAVSTRVLDSVPASFRADRKPVFYFMEGGLLGLYRFGRYKKPEEAKEIKSITVLGDEKDLPIKWLTTVVEAANFARDLINAPANDMTPTVLGDIARTVAKGKVRLRILERKAVEKEGMGAYLSVSRGSAEPLKFIVMEYRGGKGPYVVLIGKSITFDSGGISLKPADGMEKMKYDMAGGAAALAVMKAVAELGIPVNIACILPATENLPGGSASRPGDIVGTVSGKTIEIINTDAEGRLALADAIGYAIKHFKPGAIIDIATLTGACSIALGNEAVAMMGNNAELMEGLKRASEETYERVWQMPLYEEYGEYIKSDVADLKNSGGRNGSLVTAGYFLKEFAGDTPWVHLDIASTAWNEKDRPYMPKGATGIGVRLILDFLNRNYHK